MINWISVENEVPQKDGIENLLCYVHIKYIHNGEENHANVYDWFYDDPVDGGYWLKNEGQVTHWIYAKDLPFPK